MMPHPAVILRDSRVTYITTLSSCILLNGGPHSHILDLNKLAGFHNRVCAFASDIVLASCPLSMFRNDVAFGSASASAPSARPIDEIGEGVGGMSFVMVNRSSPANLLFGRRRVARRWKVHSDFSPHQVSHDNSLRWDWCWAAPACDLPDRALWPRLLLCVWSHVPTC